MNIAIVTGASSGIGADFCRELDDRGLECIWRVSRNASRMGSLADGLSTPVRIVPCDLASVADRDSLRALISEEAPDIGYLVNCAGLGRFGDPVGMPVEDARAMIDVNISAVVELTSACIPFMRPGSRIITLCSEAAYVSTYNLNVYASTKSFIRSYLDALRLEVEDRGIGVLEVSPGWVDTPFIEDCIDNHDVPEKVFGHKVQSIDVVRKALKDSDSGRRRSVCGFQTRMVIALASHLPGFAARIWRGYWK